MRSFCRLIAPALLAVFSAAGQPMKPNPSPTNLLFEASQPARLASQIVNDDVMGGESTSRFEVTNGVAVFSGRVSLANNGGFASVRLQLPQWPTSRAPAFKLRVRGDGRRYKFTARMEDGFQSALYQSAFDTRAGEWQDLRLPLADFKPTLRGRVLTGEPPLRADQLKAIGFLIADQQAGPFRLEVARVALSQP
jgi:monofunctional biosynthetic peptidoglycan transglycosylase